MASKKKSVVSPTVEVEVETPAEETAIPPSSPEVDLDTYSDNLSSEQLSRLSGPRKEINRPDLSNLPNAIGPDGYPLFVKGDRIVIERRASFLAGNPYLDTRTYRVEAVDLDTGKVNLWDESLSQYATDNWKHGVRVGQVYKLSLGRLVTTKRKRGRPRKTVATPVPAVTTKPGEKKKRGRPKGVKNRAKEVIHAEKKERAAKKVRRAKK